jgi:hypothetical protein
MAYIEDIDFLLDLDGVIIGQQGGYWTKFEVKLIKSMERRNHNIRYSLTLHDREGKRIIGFDNAHPVKAKRKGVKEKYTYDHWHRYENDHGIPYEFISAHQLLKDFWMAVDKTFQKLGVEEV